MRKIIYSYLAVFLIICLAFAKPISPALEQVSPISDLESHLNAADAADKPTSEPTPSIQPNKEHYDQPQNVPALSQLPELPNGCEAVAATMLLNWAGLPVTKEEVADALPRGQMPYANEDGAFIGSNPKDVFVGDPYGLGYGIYHKPITDLMNKWLPGSIKDISGSTFEDLLATITSGKPAVIWATEHMDTPYLELEWLDEEGRLVEWYQPEHALLLTGWDDDFAYMNDPMTGKQEAYAIADFKVVWELMGSQAITVN